MRFRVIGERPLGVPVGIILTRFIEAGRPAHCEWYHSLSWDPVLYHGKRTGWTQPHITLYFLHVNAMWPADPNSCRFDVPIRMDYTLELGARSDPSPFSGFSHDTLSHHLEKEPRHTQPLLMWVSNMPAAKSVNWAEMGEGWLCRTAKAAWKFQNLFFYKLFRKCFITNLCFVTGSKKDIQKTQKKK